jgi:DNA replication ATP-dependent helicase Dna2
MIINLIINVFDSLSPNVSDPKPNLQTEYIVNNRQHMIIVEPDLLLTGTRVSQSFLCQRRAVLNERYHVAIGSPSSAALYGIAAHELLEHILLKENIWETTEADLLNFINNFIENCIEDLYSLNGSIENLRTYLMSIVPALLQWTKQYILPLDDLTIAAAESKPRYSVLDTEETVWSVLFGLKGKIDVTLVSHQSQKAVPLGPTESSCIGLLQQKPNRISNANNNGVTVFTPNKEE